MFFLIAGNRNGARTILCILHYSYEEKTPVALKSLVGPPFSSYGAIVSGILYNPPVCKSSREGRPALPNLSRSLTNGTQLCMVDHETFRFIFNTIKANTRRGNKIFDLYVIVSS